MKKIYFLLILLILFGCDFSPKKLILVNNSKQHIYYDLSRNYELYKNMYVYELLSFDTVKPDFVKISIPKSKGVWESMINNGCVDSALHIYIFSTSNITQEIIDNKKYLRYDFTVKQLDSMNWTFVFNGSEKFKCDSMDIIKDTLKINIDDTLEFDLNKINE